MTDPRYPIGKFAGVENLTPEDRAAKIEEIETAPLDLRKALGGLNGEQLEMNYRAGGWTIRQLVHHVADSHINAYCRLRHALTEDTPTIKPYDENLWAQLHDATAAPVGISLALLDAVHTRWAILWRSLQPEQFGRQFVHPASGTHSIDWLLACYAWHGAHHTAHITEFRRANGF